MAKQSKNRVKLEKQYRKIGIIPKSAITRICKFIEIPDNANTIRANPSNVLKHNESHLNSIKHALDTLGITKESYADILPKTTTKYGWGTDPNLLAY
ncbi:MAG: hypothetical protein IJK78_06665 [Bacteroidales bacterium]|nr:hypothetical protein [Bacteroidales bacterium]